MKLIVVVGGGPAGMMAAGAAASKPGNRVILLEKNAGLGKKLLITGKGRCNVTNACEREELFRNIPGNPRFMRSSLSGFDNFSLIDFFGGLGLELKTERGNRVFPASDKSADVLKAMAAFLRKTGAEVRLNAPALGIKAENGRVSGVFTEAGLVAADSVIVAAGGLSYPATGSTGDGYAFAKALGHGVTETYPSLVPLTVKEKWAARLQGLSLKNSAITLKDGETVLYRDFGEMLFTHYGVSGPMILSASRYVLGKYNKGCHIVIDLKPALDEAALDARILRDFAGAKNRDFRNSLGELLPKALIPVITELSGIDGAKKVNSITKEERRRLLGLIKGLTLTVTGARGYDEAVITVGGVCVDEINPKTMESAKVKGLYFCGEVLDVDGYTGGFNLQIAFSTGYAAGVGQ